MTQSRWAMPDTECVETLHALRAEVIAYIDARTNAMRAARGVDDIKHRRHLALKCRAEAFLRQVNIQIRRSNLAAEHGKVRGRE